MLILPKNILFLNRYVGCRPPFLYPGVLTLLGLLLTSLAACSTVPETRAGTCKVERVAEMPVRFVEGAILVPGHINGAAVQMQLDTGATTSMLDQAAATRLSLPDDAHRRTTLHGIGGDIISQNALVSSFEVGGQEWRSVSITTGHLATRFHEAPPVVGLLGGDRLANFDVELDVPHGRMTLWSVAQCEGNFVAWTVPHYVIPLVRDAPNRMVAQVEIDGHPVEALVDWGARSTTITDSVAAGIGVTPDMLASDRSGSSWGIDQTQKSVRLHKFGELRLGREIFHNIGLPVADLHLREAGMLLGADYAHTRRIWLSYATRQMFVIPPNWAGQPDP
jgi:predicted aspartyl protease